MHVGQKIIMILNQSIHDSSMPPLLSLQGKRAIANHDAIAYEKARRSN